jgi:hypothetical protein
MRLVQVFPIISFALIGCASHPVITPQQQISLAVQDCNNKYGLSEDSLKSLGPYEIPNGWQEWTECRQEAMIKRHKALQPFPSRLR